MPKKTARATRPNQQRSKEEQWRKRMAAQARTGAPGTLVERDGFASDDNTAAMGIEPAQAQIATRSRSGGSANAVSTRTQSTSAAVQRRATAASRTSRVRLGANTLSLEEEMRYVKNDIRRLVILTTICLAVIIILSFVVPSVIK